MKIQGSVASVKLLGVQWSGACQTPFFLKTKDKYHNPLYVESRKKWYKWSLLTKQKETHRLRKQTQGSQGEEIVKDFGKVMYTLLCLKWITNKNLFYGKHKELSSVLHESLDGSRVWQRMDTWICMAESLRCSSETITTLLIDYTPISIEKIKFKKV